MSGQCYDEGAIQAFLDGELASEQLENVARHVALCDECALLLQAAEEESAFAFSMLDTEFNTLVPTERIRANLYQAISEFEKPKVSFRQRYFNFARLFANPSITAFAGLLIVAGMFAIVWNFRNQETSAPVETAGVIQLKQVQTTVAPVRGNADETSTASVQPVSKKGENLAAPRSAKIASTDFQPKFQNAKYSVESPKVKTAVRNPNPAPAESQLLSGEDTYLKTIATLKKTVDGTKDETMRPSARVTFEKDLAVVNDAIAKMQTEVRKNPKNEAAKEILRSSYQNKIDLLNSVAERNELMATLK